MKSWKQRIIITLLWLGAAQGAWAAADLSQLNVFPNPVLQRQGQNTVTFDNLTSQVRIRIFNLSGIMVRDELIDGGGNSFIWDLRNGSGMDIASGIYVYKVTNDAGEKKTGKIAIVR